MVRVCANHALARCEQENRLSGREAESHADGPFPAAGSAREGEPGRELDTLPEQPELSEVLEAEIVEAEPENTEPISATNPHVADGYTPDGFPTLDYVRQRIAASLGAEEVFDQSASAVGEEARQEALRQAAAARLAVLREGLARDER